MNELKEYREKLDEIDTQILLLLKRRLNVVEKIAKFKLLHNLDRHHPKREEEIFNKKKQLAKQLGLDEEIAVDLVNLLLKHSHKLQQNMDVK